MLFEIIFLGLFCNLNAFFLKNDGNIIQNDKSNSSLSKAVNLDNFFDVFDSDACTCKNGRCVKDSRGTWKCMCYPKHSLKGKDCDKCDCGSKGKCIFTETFSKQTKTIQYDKKCVCDTGYADKYGTCTECGCGINTKCEFEYGEKNCYCMEGYAELKGVCTECDCGYQGTCIFENRHKKCNCIKGFAEKDGLCTETCLNDEDCKENQKCKKIDGWNTCLCADGLSGSNCKELDWCKETGIFKNCKGLNGTCDYSKKERKVVCRCDDPRMKLHPFEHRCKETCSDDNDCRDYQRCETKDDWKTCVCAEGLSGPKCEEKDWCKETGIFKNCIGENGTCGYNKEERKVVCKCDEYGRKLHPFELRCKETCDDQKVCENGGVCEEGFCRCKLGTIGDKCQRILDCLPSGKYRGCESSGGECTDYGSGFICKCPKNKKYHDKNHSCIDTCSNDENCKDNQMCRNIDGWNTCVCANGLNGPNCEEMDWCKENGIFKNCLGVNGTCEYSKEKRKVICQCEEPRMKFYPFENRCRETCVDDTNCRNGGVCEEGFCRCKLGTIGDKCQRILDCLPSGKYRGCESSGGECTDYASGFICKCPKNQKYNDEKHSCIDTCSKDQDCDFNQMCRRIDGWNTCVCANGLSGSNCEEMDWCSGIFTKCTGLNGTCEYSKEKRKVVCKCDEPRTKFHPFENRCRETCYGDTDCRNGGVCEDGFCRCKLGTIGDKCERVLDCLPTGKYKGCESSGGECTDYASGFICKCPKNKKYHDKKHSCLATCLRNGDCKETEKCTNINGWNTCVCADGLSGDNCEEKDWCNEVGKFKNCRGENGTCEYNKEKRSVDCVCASGQKLHLIENRCKDSCANNYECQNGGSCKNNFCSCKSGLFGDKCEKIFDCTPNGKYRGCEISGGNCIHNGTNTACECPDHKKYHDAHHLCKACHCGVHGSCAFDYEDKICICDKGYSVKNGTCEICDCGENGYCSFQGDEKVCKCNAGYSENYGICEICDCGEGGWCTFRNGEKICECGEKYAEKHGKCEICDCGTQGWCHFVGKEKSCKCKEGYAEKNGICEVCSCGKNTVCKFIYGAKACACLEGYSFNDKSGECEECDCGEDALDCSFVGGERYCKCSIGFAAVNGRCKRIQSCEPNPCVNGHCVMREDDFLCVCDNPFTGRYCEISTCIETKCFGGRCKVIGNREECICPVGHELTNATCIKTFCVEKKCYDGECVIQNGIETCVCPEDYVSEGNECRKVKCSQKSCIGGTCRILRGNIEDCVCPIGHVLIGDTCIITTCTPRTCYGGRCEKRDDQLICICPDGFHLEGVGCIETTCKEQNCFGGKCRVLNGEEICTCLDGFILKKDQCQKARCIEKHCFGGKCDVVDGEEVCSCPVGFEVQGDVCRGLSCSLNFVKNLNSGFFKNRYVTLYYKILQDTKF